MAEEKKRKVVGVEDPKIETKRLTIFLIAVFGIAWIAELGVIKPMYQSGDVDTVKEAVNMISSMMFAPAFASLIARGLREIGGIYAELLLDDLKL